MSPTANPGLAAVPFRDPQRAALNYERIAAAAPAALLESLPNLLAETPDPDAALNGLERLIAAADPHLLRTLQQQPTLIYYALTVFAYSQFLGDTLLQNPDLFSALLRERAFQRSHHADEFREALARHRSRAQESDLSAALAGFKRREFIRIMLRDVLGIATLAETTAEISSLADVLIAESLREAQSLLRNRYGVPRLCDSAGRWVEPAVAILALGKLGGAELNYSSDVDLLFLYQDDGEVADAAGASISNREYFIRLAQLVTDLLSRSTREGPVFRIDLRLRPRGREGEPAVGLRHALDYYAHAAHDWEIQAMIKARHSAGDAALSRQFLRGVEPFVYRREVNFPAIETALLSLQKISRHHRSTTIDVKNDRGGIRDIEFLAQCLQRVYGGPDRWLRAAGTLVSIHKLHDKGHLSGKTFHELSTAYEFLRRVEHRLQLLQGQQTHRLPQSREQLAILWRLLGGGKTSAAHATGATVAEPDDPAAEMVRAVRRHMTAVGEIYNRIVHQQQVQQERSAAAPVSAGDAADFHLQPPPFDPGSEHAFQQMLGRLAADAPELFDIASRRDLGAVARRNLHRFLSAAFTTSERYAVVVRHPAALDRALALFETSEFLTDILVRHPEEIVTLEAAASGAQQDTALFPATPAPPESDALLEYIVTAGLSQNDKMAALRQHYRHRIFAAGARDILALRPVFDSLADATGAAVAAIRAAFVIAEAPPSLAVLALGRLGSAEFDIGSDADLLFVCGDDADHAAATRAAERLTHVLAAYTREGAVFSVDSRLRPRGLEGELVITAGHLAAYFASAAQPWEALSYTKLRPLVGAHDVAFQALGAVRRSLPRFAADSAFPASLRAMRHRLEHSGQSFGDTVSGEPPASDAAPNFKLAAGGFYDIDFIASYLLILANCHPEPDAANAAAQSNDLAFFPRPHILDALAALAARGLLSGDDHRALASAAALLRTTEHVVRLVQGRARKSLPTAAHARATTERLTAAILRRQFPAGLEAELRASAARVRDIFDRILR